MPSSGHRSFDRFARTCSPPPTRGPASFELIFLLGDLAAVGPIPRPFFLRRVADTRLAEQLPRLGDLDAAAPATLAEPLPCVVDSLDPTERRDLLRL